MNFVPESPSTDSIFIERRILREGRCLVEDDRDGQVGVHGDGVVLVGRPVEAGHTHHLAAAGAAHHDVVAALADELVEAAIAKEHIVAVDAVMGEYLIEVVARGAVESPGFDPVVPFVAENTLGILVAVDEVVSFTREHFRTLVCAEEDEVLARATHYQVETRTGMNNVVTVTGLDVVIAAGILDDVVACTAVDDVVAEPALEVIVAAIAEQRIVANPGDHLVGCFRTAEHDVFTASVTKVIRVRAGG